MLPTSISQQKFSRRQVRQVEALAKYAANFIYNPGRVHSAPDALSRIPGINAALDIYDKSALLEAVRPAQLLSQNNESLQFRHATSNPTSQFSTNTGVIVKKMANSCPLVILGDALSLRQKVLKELHMLPFGGHLGYRKLLELVRARFWWLHLN